MLIYFIITSYDIIMIYADIFCNKADRDGQSNDQTEVDEGEQWEYLKMMSMMTLMNYSYKKL